MKQHIFLHVPKTAGSSVRTLIQQNYPSEATLGFSGEKAQIDWYKSRPAAHKRRYALVHGHFHYGIHESLQRYTYFTFLRAPVARHFSEYDFLRRYEPHPLHEVIVKQGVTAEQWASIFDRYPMFSDFTTRYVCGETRGPEVDRLSLEKAKLYLRCEFALVGLAERFDESVLILARRLGWQSVFYLTRNVSGDRTRPSEALIAATEQGLRRDLELYRFAQDLFEELPELRSSEFQDALAEFRNVRSWLESYVTNNPNAVYVVGQELPQLDEIVRAHRATPVLDRFLGKPTPAQTTVPQDRVEWEAQRVRHSLLAEPPRPLPPLPMMQTSGSATKEHYLATMRDYVADILVQTKLKPAGHVLDLGSGCGRLAAGLTRYLDEESSYLGLDVWEEGVAWCNEHLATITPPMTFDLVHAANNYYFAEDTLQPNRFDLSRVPSNRFDAVVALSLFSHIKRCDARQYLALIARALAPEGLAYLTCFVLDEDARRRLAETNAQPGLWPAGDGMWYGYSRRDFFAGYEPELLLRDLDEAGLEIVAQSPGAWVGKPGARLYEDWYLLKRRSAGQP